MKFPPINSGGRQLEEKGEKGGEKEEKEGRHCDRGERKESGGENDLKKGREDTKEKNTGGKRKRGNRPALQRKEEVRQEARQQISR